MGCTFINEPLQGVILLLNDEKIAPAKIQNLDFFLIFQKYFKEKNLGNPEFSGVETGSGVETAPAWLVASRNPDVRPDIDFVRPYRDITNYPKFTQIWVKFG